MTMPVLVAPEAARRVARRSVRAGSGFRNGGLCAGEGVRAFLWPGEERL